MIFCRKIFVARCRKKTYRNLLLSHCFGYRKILSLRGVGHEFLSNIFCLTKPKKFAEESFSVSFFSGIENFYAKEGYVMIFCRKIFVAQCRKKLYRILLVFKSFRLLKKFTHKRVCHDILSKIFCLTVSKKIVQESFSVSLIRVSKKVLH